MWVGVPQAGARDADTGPPDSPLLCPRWMMALEGFWAITVSRPPLVQVVATSFPTEMSRYCRNPVSLCRSEKRSWGVEENAPRLCQASRSWCFPAQLAWVDS